MKVLITGGLGFIGGHLAHSFAADGHDVTILDNFNRGVRDNFIDDCVNRLGVKLKKADLLHEESLDGLPADFTHIFHLAAIIGVGHVLRRPYDVLTHNVRMTDGIINFCRRQSVLQRVIFSSTSEVYAGSLHHLNMPIPTPESTPIALPGLEQPRTSYMLSKLYGEAMFNLSGLPVTILRLHNIYGPRMGLSHVIPELLFKAWSARDGEALPVSSVDHSRAFCYVSDAVLMIRALTETLGAVGQTINIGNQSPEITIGKLTEIIVDTVGRNLTVIPQLPTPGSPSRRCPDTTRLKELTGVTGQVTLADGIRKTFDWYVNNVFSGGLTAK